MVRRYDTELARRLGQNLAHYRHRAGMTQERLAECLEVEVATVSRYETGSTLPSLVTLEAVASLLHTTIATLLAEDAPSRSDEGERLLAMLEPLLPEQRRVVLKILEPFVEFLREKPTTVPSSIPIPKASSPL